MKTSIHLGVILSAALSLSANAAIFNLEADIDGAQANGGAGTGSPATGVATMTYDDISGLFNWNISWAGLAGNITVAHFHGPAPAGSNAGVQVDIGAISGLTSPSIGNAVITTAQGTDLVDGLWYINIHSSLHPAGEIRGQVNVVPVPAAAWLFGSALLGLAGIGRKRKQAA